MHPLAKAEQEYDSIFFKVHKCRERGNRSKSGSLFAAGCQKLQFQILLTRLARVLHFAWSVSVVKRTRINLIILLIGMLSPIGATAGQVFEVHMVYEGNILRAGELEMPDGVNVQLPVGPSKNCTATGEEGFPDCQPLVFRPDSRTFSGINGSSTGLTGELTAASAVWVIDMSDEPTLTTLIAGFSQDFGSVITDGEDDFQFAEIYFDNRINGPKAPNQVCAAAETTLLTYDGCFAADDVLKTPTVAFEFEAPPSDFANNALFYDPANSGHGFDFNVIPGGLVVYYYGHTASGERLWLISDVHTEDLQYGVPFELDMYEIVEGVFGQPGSPASIWGTITFTLDDCNSGHASFSGIEGNLEMDLVRLVGLPGSRCQ